VTALSEIGRPRSTICRALWRINCTRAVSYGSRVSGMLNKQIASEIGASEATVKIHRGNVMRKMKTGSVVDLVRMADKLKLSPRK